MSNATPDAESKVLHCPSAAAESPEARVFGIVTGALGAPRVEYLAEPDPLTKAMESQLGGLHPGEVFRLTSPCAEAHCLNYSGHHCRLGERIARQQDGTVASLVPCPIRGKCRWFAEQGGAACGPCSRVITELPVRLAANGHGPKKTGRHLPMVLAPRAAGAEEIATREQ